MKHNKRVVAFVPLKFHSQRLPNKNILLLSGQPMCWHIFSQLKKCAYIDDIYAYCSEESIKKYIPDSIKFLKRPSFLDNDSIIGEQIYREFINSVDADVYILAHATSPLVQFESINTGLEKVLSGQYDSAFSVKEERTFAWYDGKPINYSQEHVVRTQDLEPVYLETSAFFIFEKTIFTKYNRRIGFRPYMCVLNDKEAIDIDTIEDYTLAKYYMEQYSNTNQ